jgi:cytochrome c oxidase subunit 2
MTSDNGKTPNYEFRWIVIGLIGLAVLLVLSLWRMYSGPGRIPTNPQTGSVQSILNSPMFRHPGVVKLGPHHYRVAVIARQFQFDPAKIMVPANAKIDFYVTSADVLHGFELPGTDINVEVLPGYVAHVFATFRTPHHYLTVCDQYCGIGHQNMIGAFDVVAHMPAPAAPGQAAAASGSSPAALVKAGQDIYASHCAACHQANGAGLGSAFPPLAGSTAAYIKSPAGRTALADILLYGLHGKIEANGQSYNGVMPAWDSQLNDQQIAAVIAYIAGAWGNDAKQPPDYKPLAPAAIKALRAHSMTPDQVHAARAAALGAGSSDTGK